MPDARCSDSDFAIANPSICPTVPALIIKPASVVLCEGNSTQFRVASYANGVETELTEGVEFSSSDLSIFPIGVNGGAGTAIAAGDVTIAATYQGVTVHAKIKILPGENCCSQVTVYSSIVLDISRSMSLTFGSGYPTRLDFGKAAANGYGGVILQNEDGYKDFIKVWSLAETTTDVLGAWSQDAASIMAAITTQQQTQLKTNLLRAFTVVGAELLATDATVKVLVIVSDGEQTSTEATKQQVLTAAADFKSQGGIVIVVGIRASGDGFDTLQRIASGGYFVNATPSTMQTALDALNFMKNMVCAGDCLPQGDTFANVPTLNYSNFQNLEVLSGRVNLLGPGLLDFIPNHGLYVEMADGVKAILRTIDSFTLLSTNDYRISFDLAGNQREAVAGQGVKVYARQVGAQPSDPNIFEQSIFPEFSDGFTRYTFDFSPIATVTVKLYFEQLGTDANPIGGNLLDHIKFENATDGSLLMEDNFDSENLVYIPPRCGPSEAVAMTPDPSAPIAESVLYTGGMMGDGAVTYAYKISWETNQGHTAASDVTLITPKAEDDHAVRLTLPTAPDQVVSTRIWRNIDSDDTVNLYLLAVVPGHHQYYFDNETMAEFADRYDPALTPPTDNTTAESSGEMGFGYYCDIGDCSTEPPGVQVADPNALPNIETGSSGVVYTSTKSVCLDCPSGTLPFPTTILPFQYDTFDFANPCAGNQTVVKLTNGAALVGSMCLRKPANGVTVLGVIIYGSNDLNNWTEILNIGDFFLENGQDPNTLYCYTTTATGAFLYYKATYTGVTPPSQAGNCFFTSSDRFYGSTTGSNNLVPSMTSNTAPSGQVIYSAQTTDHEAFRAFDGDENTTWEPGAATGYIGYKFEVATIITRMFITGNAPVGGSPSSFQIQGSNNGTSWTTLLSAQNFSWYNNEVKDLPFGNSDGYLYYRILVTSTNGGNLKVPEVQMFGVGTISSACGEGSGSSTVSQQDADARALAAATAEATSNLAVLNCKTVYNATVSVTVDCPAGQFGQSVTRSASYQSFVSLADAQRQASLIARAAAEAAIDCSGSNNHQRIVINDSNGSGLAAATPYASIARVDGVVGSITKVQVRLNGFSHEYPPDVRMLLVGPTGLTVELIRHATGEPPASPAVNTTIIFDDSGAPFPFTAVISGTYAPTVVGSVSDYPIPAPVNPYGAALSVFNGTDPNGSWALYVADDSSLDIGSIASGWDILITT